MANTTPMSVEPSPVAKQPSAPYVVLCEVGADHDPARPGQPTVDHDLVTDAFGEEVGDRVLDAELPDHPMQLRRRDRVGGHDVVEVEDDPGRVPQRRSKLAERLDRERAGDVVRHRNVHLGDHRVAGTAPSVQAGG